VSVGLACWLAVPTSPAWPESSRCGDGSGVQGLVSTEYAFAASARTSIRAAFLEYLAEDSLVLQPNPRPGRALYTAAKDTSDRLEWYPAIADIAGSNDLGFTTGPWVYTEAGGAKSYGDFLTVWKRDSDCRWRVELDGGISHAEPANAESKLAPDRDEDGRRAIDEPSPTLVAADAVGHAMRDFQGTAAGDGVAAGLRTYARNGDFRFYAEGEAPMGLGAANTYLTGHPLRGVWTENGHGRAADSSLAYSVGEFGEPRKPGYAYVEIWQYDPKVANWGLRILLLSPLPPPKTKS
jgi:hypothetical protein